MAKAPAIAVDVSDAPDLLRLAEEVRTSGESRLLRRGEDDLALIVPLPARRLRRRRQPTEEDLAAFRAAAGGWKDIDTDRLLEEFAESRPLTRPPVEL